MTLAGLLRKFARYAAPKNLWVHLQHQEKPGISWHSLPLAEIPMPPKKKLLFHHQHLEGSGYHGRPAASCGRSEIGRGQVNSM